MLNIYCWRCGSKISRKDILGIGRFNDNIGKYGGKNFSAFRCPECKKVRYQIRDSEQESQSELYINEFKKTISKYGQQAEKDNIDINQVIDFYQVLNEISTVNGFLEKCGFSPGSIQTDLEKPIVQPLDVFNFFNNYNQNGLKRLLILTLDDKHIPITWEFLGEGTDKPISFEPKKIFHTSFLLAEEASLIIAQNLKDKYQHPDQKEILMTKRLVKTGKILGINFLDHIVIDKDGFHSFDKMNLI